MSGFSSGASIRGFAGLTSSIITMRVNFINIKRQKQWLKPLIMGFSALSLTKTMLLAGKLCPISDCANRITGQMMKREDVLLAVLSVAGNASYSPAQLQKTMFLLSQNLPGLFETGYHFAPYDYGPFDVEVYKDSESLQREGLASITRSTKGNWKIYGVTDEGRQRGQVQLRSLPESQQKYIVDVSQWVLKQDFASLVKSIYKAYPNMRVNSIFVE